MNRPDEDEDKFDHDPDGTGWQAEAVSKREAFDKALEGLSRGAIAEVAWRHYQTAEKAEARIEALKRELADLRNAIDGKTHLQDAAPATKDNPTA